MASSSPSPSFRHARRIPRRHVLRALACALAGVVLFTGSGAWALYHELTGNISSDYSLDDFRTPGTAGGTGEPDEEATTLEPTDPRAGRPYNIVLIGSDTRGGENAGFGAGLEGARSDTTILVHIPADRSRIEAISIPRDLLTDIPSCQTDADGTMSREQPGAMFNSAFSTGAENDDVGLGAVCTALTIEKMSGIHIDDFAVVDFVGFERMVDTIGGIPICIPERIDSPKANIVLEAGQQTLNGAQALGLARARTGEGTGDGSDISRIGRQQDLLAAVVRQVLAKNLFTDTYSLIQFLDATTSSLTTSQGLSSPIQLAGLAMAVAPVGADGVTFVTMPFDYAGARVVANGYTDQLWERLRNDQPVDSSQPVTPTAEPTQAGTDPAAPTTDASTGADPSAATATGPADPEPTEEPSPSATDPWAVVKGTDESVC